MIEQINIALEQKGSGNFSAWVIGLPSETNVEKRLHQLKVMKNGNILLFLRDRMRWWAPLTHEGIAVIELQFYHFPDSDRLRVGSVTD